MPDYTGVLNDISLSLKQRGANGESVSTLVAEVRDAIKGSGDDTLRGYILGLQTSVHRDLEELKTALVRRIGGPGVGVSHASRDSNDDFEEILKSFQAIGEKIELALTALEEGGGSQGQGHGSGGGTYFQNELLIRTVRSTTDIFKLLNAGVLTTSDVLKTFSSLKTAQFETSIQSFISSMMNSAVQMTNLSTAFNKLKISVSENIASYREGIFGTNMLSPQEQMFETMDRAQKGILFDSDSFKLTVKTVKDSLEQGLVSPLSMTGKTISQLSNDMNLARQGIKNSGGPDLREFGTTEQTQRWMTDMIDTMHKFGQPSAINDAISRETVGVQTDILRKIAANTGISVDNLEKIAKKDVNENAILAALGELSGTEVQNMADMKTDLIGRLGEAGATAQEAMVKQHLAGGRGEYFNPGVNEVYGKLSAMPGALDADARRTEAYIKGDVAGLLKAITDFDEATAGMRQQGPSMYTQTRMYGNDVQKMVGANNQAANYIRTQIPPTLEQKAKEQGDPVAGLLERANSIWQNQISPALHGLDTAIGAQVIAIWANTFAIKTLALQMLGMNAMNAAGGGGALGLASRFAGGALKYGTIGLAGAAVGQVEQVVAPSKTQTGALSGIAGSAVGGILGNMGGGAIAGMMAGRIGGGILGSIAGPVGTVIGAALLGYVGGKIGDYFSSPVKDAEVGAATATTAATAAASAATAATSARSQTETPQVTTPLPPRVESPAVPVPTNMTGPDPATVSAIYGLSNIAQTAQDQQYKILSSLYDVSLTSNNTLSQMLGELTRQSGLLTGSPTSASTTRPLGTGLSVPVAATAGSTRSDIGTPAVGNA